MSEMILRVHLWPYQNHVRKIVHKIKRHLFYYAVICFALGYCFMRIPSSFLPTEDQGVLMTMANLPAGSTSEKTNIVLDKIQDYFLITEKENVESILTVSGFSFAGQGQNMGMGFIKMKDWSLRQRADQHVDSIANRAIMPLLGIREGLAYAFNIPAIPELGTASGFDLYLQDVAGAGHEKLIQVRNDYIYAAQQSPLLTQVRVNGVRMTVRKQAQVMIMKRPCRQV